MGYRGTLRGLVALSRSMEREAKRQQRALEKRQKELTKMEEWERDEYEVEAYENRIDILKSIHKDCSDIWDWEKIKTLNPPEEPKPNQENELQAQNIFDNYTPSFLKKY